VSHNYYDRWKIGVHERSRDSMSAQGWLKLTDTKQRGQHGWFRRSEDSRKEIITYKNFDGEDSLAFSWGYDLARKGLPRSFVEQIAGDYSGSLFAAVLLKGFDDFHRPAKVERIRLDYEREAQG
jgi:hypothetical protein